MAIFTKVKVVFVKFGGEKDFSLSQIEMLKYDILSLLLLVI